MVDNVSPVVLAADRVGKGSLRRLAADLTPGSSVQQETARLAANPHLLPQGLLDPLVAMIAELVLTLMTAACGDTFERAADFLRRRPPFLFRTARIRGAVRYYWQSRPRSDAVRNWNPDLLADAVDDECRKLTADDLRELYTDAQRVKPRWAPDQP